LREKLLNSRKSAKLANQTHGPNCTKSHNINYTTLERDLIIIR
jgi:hypothetical protein